MPTIVSSTDLVATTLRKFVTAASDTGVYISAWKFGGGTPDSEGMYPTVEKTDGVNTSYLSQDLYGEDDSGRDEYNYHETYITSGTESTLCCLAQVEEPDSVLQLVSSFAGRSRPAEGILFPIAHRANHGASSGGLWWPVDTADFLHCFAVGRSGGRFSPRKSVPTVSELNKGISAGNDALDVVIACGVYDFTGEVTGKVGATSVAGMNEIVTTRYTQGIVKFYNSGGFEAGNDIAYFVDYIWAGEPTDSSDLAQIKRFKSSVHTIASGTFLSTYVYAGGTMVNEEDGVTYVPMPEKYLGVMQWLMIGRGYSAAFEDGVSSYSSLNKIVTAGGHETEGTILSACRVDFSAGPTATLRDIANFDSVVYNGTTLRYDFVLSVPYTDTSQMWVKACLNYGSTISRTDIFGTTAEIVDESNISIGVVSSVSSGFVECDGTGTPNSLSVMILGK